MTPPPDPSPKRERKNVERNLEDERRVGDPSFKEWSEVQWVPYLTNIHTGKTY
jgi:hypothetical protein